MKLYLLHIFVYIPILGFAQVLPETRSVDWTLAGLKDTTTTSFQLIDMQLSGAVGDSITPNDVVLSNVISSLSGGGILEFQNGNYLFNSTINLPSNIIIRGQGAENTKLIMDLGGSGDAFSIQGNSSNLDTSSFVQAGIKDSVFIEVISISNFSNGDWIQIIQNDTDLVTSTWAYGSVGQIVEIDNVIGNKIILKSPLRMDFDILRKPFIRKVLPIKNVGIECLKILRLDDTAPQQTSNINFKYSVNCWVSGIESENSTFSHIQARQSSNIEVLKSYMHHAFDYGGGGRGYGVMIHSTSNECLVEDNIFEHLRHSMIVQSGANGNVFSYNYSWDPYWTSTPNNSAGDMVLHGNYPYCNLFEQNVCQNIVIDNSHGPNGPHNTFFRNRAEGFGIFFSATNSPNQNLIGNDIPNTTFPYSLVNYTILGIDHFIHGNNNKGIIDLPGTQSLTDSSYAYNQKPSFIPFVQWAGIGTPNVMGANNIPAFDRYTAGNLFSNSCNNIITKIGYGSDVKMDVIVYPNPIKSNLTIESKNLIKNILVTNSLGKIISFNQEITFSNQINTVGWVGGVYFITINLINNRSVIKKVVRLE